MPAKDGGPDTMLKWLAKLWKIGARDTDPAMRRRIMLSNQLAVFGAVTTLPYQLFYACTAFTYYAPVFASNVVIMSGYLWTLRANHRRRHDSARNFVVLVAMIQLAVVTWYLGRGLGVHLFYFTIVSILPLLFERARATTIGALAFANVLLFWICDQYFGNGTVPLLVPDTARSVAFGFSAAAAVALISAFMLLFRHQIDVVEQSLRRTNRELERLSATDALTELPNRRAVDAFLVRWSQTPDATVGVVLCDIDYFKLYNDHYGHLLGDRTLHAIGTALRGATRCDFDIVARYGGEEFMILLPQADAAYIRSAAERLRAAVEALAIEHAYRPDAFGIVTVSVGYSRFDTLDWTPGAPKREPIDAADQALYRAKSLGRNRTESGFLGD
ncbi:diguanylate cyclase [uncultured Salinisphaera sp.]|uniref:GGDEF domain-containing protein n=1 Tax=uncultured Salinisphaera sp. TaxID=359372 RepID=UPI0032B1070D